MRSKLVYFCLITLLIGSGPALRAESVGTGHPIVWDRDHQRIGADLDGWPLSSVLELLARETGWTIRVEPGLEHTVSTRFTDLRVAEALSRFLGDLNYSLIPDSTGLPRLAIYRNSSGQATEKITPHLEVPATTTRLLKDELILSVKPGGNVDIEALAKELGAKIVDRSDKTGAYRLRFDDEQTADRARERLAQRSGLNIDSNYEISRTNPYADLRQGQLALGNLATKSSADSEYTILALLDTSVSYEDEDLARFLLPGIKTKPGDPPTTTGLSHGTAMAETMLQAIASSQQDSSGTMVRILPIDIYGGGASTTTFDVAQGLYAAAAAGADIVNLSLGSDTDSPFLRHYIQQVTAQGALIVAAAGNEPVVSPTFPAAYPEVLAVTAGNSSGEIASYANRGDFVDVIGPGTAVVHQGEQAYLGTGTSYASAYTSGLAASIASQGNVPPQQAALTILDRMPAKPTAP